MTKKRNLGINGEFWWVWAIATFIFIAFWGYLYLPLVLSLFVVYGIYFLVFDKKSTHQKFEESLSEGESLAPKEENTIRQSNSDAEDAPMQADLCGHPRAKLVFMEPVGSKVRKGQIVMRFEVLSTRLNKTLGLAEYAGRNGVLEPLVQIGDEILHKQAIYRIRVVRD
jgi:hypothetical protein